MSQFPSDTNLSSDFSVPSEPPAWPKVVGIISIVWGSIGGLCNVCGLAGGAMQSAIVGMAPPEQQDQIRQQMAAGNTPLSMALYVIGVLVALLLLFAGIQTVRRLAVGRMLHLVYGVIGIVLLVAGGINGWGQMQTQVQNTLQNDPNAAQAAGAVKGMALGIFGCIMVVSAVWPLFCLVWFGAMGKRPEAGAALEEPLV